MKARGMEARGMEALRRGDPRYGGSSHGDPRYGGIEARSFEKFKVQFAKTFEQHSKILRQNRPFLIEKGAPSKKN